MDNNDLVVKSNALIEASYSLTLAEQQVLLAAIAQVRRDECVTDEVLYEITANALADVAGFRAKHEYDVLREVAERLWNRTLVVKEKPNGGGPVSTSERWIRWVQECVYVEAEGRIELRFSKAILPYLTELKSRFTSYERRQVAKMRSRYGIRLFELIMQWRSSGEREIEIDWLREVWQLTDKYKLFADMKKRVIEPAVRDINDCTDWQVKVGYRKRGRRVVSLQLKFGPKNKKPAAQRKPKITKSMLISMSRPGESWSALAERAIRSGYDKKHVYRLIREAQSS